ncbi:MAG: hypothetical protein MK212_16370 [Saprospiraceae bacterium]|nr:hypothetical protein [Saprospiraceae bacterium]
MTLINRTACYVLLFCFSHSHLMAQKDCEGKTKRLEFKLKLIQIDHKTQKEYILLDSDVVLKTMKVIDSENHNQAISSFCFIDGMEAKTSSTVTNSIKAYSFSSPTDSLYLTETCDCAEKDMPNYTADLRYIFSLPVIHPLADYSPSSLFFGFRIRVNTADHMIYRQGKTHALNKTFTIYPPNSYDDIRYFRIEVDEEKIRQHFINEEIFFEHAVLSSKISSTHPYVLETD